MKPIQCVKMACSFLYVMSKLFHPIILNVSNPTSKTGEMTAPFFYLESFLTNHQSWFEHTAELSCNA